MIQQNIQNVCAAMSQISLLIILCSLVIVFARGSPIMQNFHIGQRRFSSDSTKYGQADLSVPCLHVFLQVSLNGPVYKTSLVWTKSLSDYGLDQIWLCKRYLSVPNIWSQPKSGPKRDLLMCKDHGPIEFGPVPNLDM